MILFPNAVWCFITNPLKSTNTGVQLVVWRIMNKRSCHPSICPIWNVPLIRFTPTTWGHREQRAQGTIVMSVRTRRAFKEKYDFSRIEQYLASWDAIEPTWVTESLSQSVTLRTELTDVTLVSEDTYCRLYQWDSGNWCYSWRWY